MLCAWLTARLSMADPKHFPTYESLLGRNADDRQEDVGQKLYARLAAISRAQDKQPPADD